MAQKGRNILVQVSDGGGSPVFTTVAGIRSRTLSITNDGVDITTSDEAPWTTLLGDTGARAVSLSGSGVFQDDVLGANTLEDLAFDGTLREFKLIFENLDEIQGFFLVNSFEYGGEHLGEQTFSASMSSSGQVTLTRN